MSQEIVEVPITGKITQINVKPGDEVKEGDIICLLESMKMENPILAPVSGKVIEIKTTVGKLVNPGEALAIIQY